VLLGGLVVLLGLLRQSILHVRRLHTKRLGHAVRELTWHHLLGLLLLGLEV
jgi:hypothetical protein